MLVYRQRGSDIRLVRILQNIIFSLNISEVSTILYAACPKTMNSKNPATYNVNIRDKCIADIKLI